MFGIVISLVIMFLVLRGTSMPVREANGVLPSFGCLVEQPII